MPTPAAVTPAELLALATQVARGAAEVVRRRPADLGVDTKSTPTDVVTSVDGATERFIVEALRAARPDDGVLGEEGAGSGGRSGVRWLVDPIDGTVNYLYDVPAYAVSLAAEQDGEVVAGVVVDVAAGALYAAVRGGGATRDGTPLRCSTQEQLSQALVATGFGYDADMRRRQAVLLTAVLPEVRDIRRFGSCALDLCAVAQGRFDGYYEHGASIWDYAAAALIAQEAGAMVRVTEGGLVVASGPGIFDALTALVPATLPGLPSPTPPPPLSP